MAAGSPSYLKASFVLSSCDSTDEGRLTGNPAESLSLEGRNSNVYPLITVSKRRGGAINPDRRGLIRVVLSGRRESCFSERGGPGEGC